MKKRRGKGFKYTSSKLINSKTLTKRESKKLESIIAKLYLKTLKENNPSVSKIRTLSEGELLEIFLSQKKYKDYYKKMLWELILKNDTLPKIKAESGSEGAVDFLVNPTIKIFLKKFDKKRFKTPPNFEVFIKEIELLQKKYLYLQEKKQRRKKLRSQQKDWKSSVDAPIAVTHELAGELYPGQPKTSKNLSKVRTKIKRAKEGGFL